MSRPHVLLHYPNERLVSGRVEAWEGKDPGGVRVRLANPRWEMRFLTFLELSGVGRVIADGTDEDGVRAAKIDEWVYERPRRGSLQKTRLHTFSYCFFVLFCKGDPYPETYA